LLLRAD
jgi:hypothetical protein